VTVALAPEACTSLRRWCRVSPAPEARCVPAMPADWTILHVSFESSEEARFVVLGFGARAQVLAPAALRDQIRTEMEAVVAHPLPALLPG
jgi:predicted DNA-binding transcriptional regulator YafY